MITPSLAAARCTCKVTSDVSIVSIDDSLRDGMVVRLMSCGARECKQAAIDGKERER
jgi:hypothetical protein